MTYTYPPEKYIELLESYNALEGLSFSPGDRREVVISNLKERSVRKREIADIANIMVREYVETFEKDPAALTPADAEALQAFLELLFPEEAVASETVTDYVVMYRISSILAGYYRRTEDWNRYVDALLLRCIAFQVFTNRHIIGSGNLPFLEEIFAMTRLLEGDELREQGRTKVRRMLQFAIISDEDQFPIERYRRILRILHSQVDRIPAEEYERRLLSAYGSISEFYYIYRACAWDLGIPVDPEEARPLLEECCGFLREHVVQDRTFDHDSELMRLLLLITDFFLGNIPLETVLDAITDIQRAMAESEDPLEQAMGLASFNCDYLTLLCRFSSLPKTEVVRLSRERVREVLPKLLNVSRVVNSVNFNQYILSFLIESSHTSSFDEFADIILETTVYADKALYIHTEMVREMSLAIFDTMIEKTPEAFSGVAGHDAAYIKAHREEMRALLSECCMFHDVGKFNILEIVENSMRRLTENEFQLIKAHPGDFEHIYHMKENEDERVKCIRDCAMTHHLWHDGSRGYPSVPQTKNRPFADILAVADSLDAATDYLGRPYNSGKTLDQLIEEFQAGAGTRYGPAAVAALSHPELREKLQSFITERREEINYQIYAFNQLQA